MEIKVSTGDIAGVESDAIIVTIFQGAEHPEGETTNVDKALDGAISRLLGHGEIKGKLNEITVIHSLSKLPAERVAVAGLGKREELSLDKIRGVVATACRLLRGKEAKNIATIAPGIGISEITDEASAQTVAEGALMGTYTFRRHITKEAEHGEIEQLTIVDNDDKAMPLIHTANSSLEAGDTTRNRNISGLSAVFEVV